MNYSSLIEQISAFIKTTFLTYTSKGLIYHDLRHTLQVVEYAEKIGAHYNLNDRDFFIVVAASWFHDIGYCSGDAKLHESTGAEMAYAFLKDKDVDDDTLADIQNCILATRIPQMPNNLLEMIVCDADLFHFGTSDFSERNKLMRKEAERRLGKKISKTEWKKSTIGFMESHHYHTDYCKDLLTARKEQNLRSLKGKENENLPPAPIDMLKKIQSTNTATSKIDNPINQKQKTERPNRGIETMFRVSSDNHQRLSDMADNKAHIMITTTSIIISVLLSLLLRKLEDNPHLIFPTLLLLSVCVVTMVFSILATRPTVPAGTFTPEDISNKKVNLLFFGNFYRMPYEDYSAGMQQLMNDREFLYGSLTKDIYSQGVVLGRKYRLLRVAYNVFMFGIVASVLAFVISSVFLGR